MRSSVDDRCSMKWAIGKRTVPTFNREDYSFCKSRSILLGSPLGKAGD